MAPPGKQASIRPMKGLKLCALLPFALWITTANCQAAPANDSLASAEELPPSGPATPGSNTGATLEAGESIPDGYNASSYTSTTWWNLELAASEPTWYEINTVGSAFDTVLSVWTGESYPLTLVHANDEASEGNVSRIRFLANPSPTVYRIAVAGRGPGQQGNIAVRATSAVEQPFAKISAASFSTNSPNVTNADANLTLTLQIEAGAEITSGLFTLYNPTGVPVLTRPFTGASNRISGSIANGSYEIKATLPQGSVPGTYRWGLQMARSAISMTSYGWEGLTPLTGNVTRTINVQNTAPVNTYASWATNNNLTGDDAGPEADFDHDGLTNLTEFAFGLDPRQPSQSVLGAAPGLISHTGLPRITCVGQGNQRRLHVEYVRRIGESSLAYTVQFSSDLINWTNATQSTTSVASNGTFEAVAVEDVTFNPAKSRRYARVRVVR